MTLSTEHSPSSTPLDWKFSQVFGERAPGEDLQDGYFLSPSLCLVTEKTVGNEFFSFNLFEVSVCLIRKFRKDVIVLFLSIFSETKTNCNLN